MMIIAIHPIVYRVHLKMPFCEKLRAEKHGNRMEIALARRIDCGRYDLPEPFAGCFFCGRSDQPENFDIFCFD